LTAGKITLTGTGEPGSQVEIVVDGKVVGTATVGKDGQWSYEVDFPTAGDYEVSVQSVDAEGKILATSQPLTLSIAEAVAPPVLDKPKGELTAGKVELSGTGEPGSQVVILINGQEVGQVTVSKDGTWSFSPDLAEAGEYEVKIQTVDDKGQVVAESKAGQLTVAKAPIITPTLDKPAADLVIGPIKLTGRGEPSSEVTIVIDGEEAGQARVNTQGRWNFTADFPQAGEYEVNIQALDDKGQVLAESGGTRLAIAAPTTPCSEIYTVQKDDWLTKLALKYYNEMFDYPLIVDATNAKAQEDSDFVTITNPDLIEIGQQLCIPEKP
jgi:nucleoid-associated protein YgaU